VDGVEEDSIGVPESGADEPTVGARPPAGAGEESNDGLSVDPAGFSEDSMGSFELGTEELVGSFIDGVTFEDGEGRKEGGLSAGESKRACMG
jgi:hypothetical protein